MRQTFIRYLLLITVFTALAGCNTWKDEDRMTKFNDSFRAYSKHLRWGHFHEVSSLMTTAHIAPAVATIPSLKNVRITAIEPLKWLVDETRENISGNVRIDYYLEDRGVVKQISQPQVWRWFEEPGTWKLDSGLPQLK